MTDASGRVGGLAGQPDVSETYTLELLTEAAGLGVWRWYPAQERVECSPVCLAQHGLPTGADLTYRQWLSSAHPDDRPRLARAIAACIAARTDCAEQYRALRPDGSVRWLSLTARPFQHADGDVERVDGVMQDITGLRATEQALAGSQAVLEARNRQVESLNVQLAQRALEVETASRARDAFLRNVSHEFRTPLNHIVGGAELLRMGLTDDRQAQWLRIILDAAQELTGIIDRTLAVARQAADPLALKRVTFAPAKVLAEVRLMMSVRAEQKGLLLSVGMDAALPGAVIGDPARVAQALLNYLDNAIKYTERGAVRVAARALASGSGSVLVRFEVSDTGIGVQPDLRPRLFTPFSRGDSTITHMHGGLGLGLAMTRELAVLMGGEVGVDSTPGRGSTFWFTARFAAAGPDAHSAH